MAATSDLIALQETDLELDKALARLAEIEESLGEPEELIDARAALEEKVAALRELSAQQKDRELAADEVRTKAADVEKKLYGGSVKNPKELQDLDADLKSLKELLRKREDYLLALLELVDAAETEEAAARAEFESIDGDWKRCCDEMLAEKARLEPDVERLRGIRDSQSGGVERNILKLYDLVRSRRGGLAVARVERGMCQGCRISLPMSVMQRLRSGGGLIQCVSCERILLVQ
jgi:predicted  nucleic acid-binding Zn-ribbon protein